MPRKPKQPTLGERVHALEHLLAGLIRKYGEQGRRVTLDEETYEGRYNIWFAMQGTQLVVELRDACHSCDSHAP